MPTEQAGPPRATILHRPWEPDDGPVLALLELSLGSRLTRLGLVAGTPTPRLVEVPLPAPAEPWAGVLSILAARGWTVLFQRWAATARATGSRRDPNIYRADLVTGAVEQLNVHPTVDEADLCVFGASPDGTKVAVMARHLDPLGRVDRWGAPWATVDIWIVEGGNARRMVSIRGAWPQNDHAFLPIQWSPDGKRLAVSMFEEGSFSCWVHVYDAGTGELLHRWPKAELVGSASWSPDGTRVVVNVPLLGTHVLSLATGEKTPVPGAPIPDEPRGGRALPAGFFDDEHLVVYAERGSGSGHSAVTLSLLPVAGTERMPFLRFRLPTEYVYPHFLSPVPPSLVPPELRPRSTADA